MATIFAGFGADSWTGLKAGASQKASWFLSERNRDRPSSIGRREARMRLQKNQINFDCIALAALNLL